MQAKRQHTIHDLQCGMADMIYQKYQQDLYSLKACVDDYNTEVMEEDKLLLDVLQSDTRCGDVRHPKVVSVPLLCAATNQTTIDSFYSPTRKSSFEFVQSTPTGVWLITHSLGYNPQVVIVDFSGHNLTGQIQYINTNTLQITFTSLLSGKAYLYPTQ